MQNWYCLVHFPDDSASVHLVPGPAPLPTHGKAARIITVIGKPGLWRVTYCTARAQGNDYAAAIWVEPHEPA